MWTKSVMVLMGSWSSNTIEKMIGQNLHQWLQMLNVAIHLLQVKCLSNSFKDENLTDDKLTIKIIKIACLKNLYVCDT